MNEKLQYAKMLDMPVTSTVTHKKQKKSFFKKMKKIDEEKIKESVIDKVNAENQETMLNKTDEISDINSEVKETILSTKTDDVMDDSVTSRVTKKRKEKKRFKWNVIATQLSVIAVLSLGILVTNALMPNSGLNVFFEQVFGTGESVDVRTYDEFTLKFHPSNSSSLTLENGVVSIGEVGSIYAPCDGVVVNASLGEDGKYTVEISHSQNFKSVISGLDRVYASKDGKILKNIPVGYLSEGKATVCFYHGDDAVIVNFTLSDDAVVWAV